jgi:hypothetical protein
MPTITSMPTTESAMTIPPQTTAPPTQASTTTATPATSAVQTLITVPNPAPANNPYINYFEFSVWRMNMSDCIMKQIFSDIANNPSYGFKAKPPYLVGMSKSSVQQKYSDYLTGENAGQSGSTATVSCPDNPLSEANTWRFEEVNTTFTPRNVRPSLYMIVLDVTSDGERVAQVTENRTLTMDQPVQLDILIPLKGTETVRLVKLGFIRLEN